MDRLPDDIAEAIESYGITCEDMGASYDSKGFPTPEREGIAKEARIALDAAILKHINRDGRSQTFPCPKCGVTRSWLPACAQDECPLLGLDGKPMARFTALAAASRGQTGEGV